MNKSFSRFFCVCFSLVFSLPLVTQGVERRTGPPSNIAGSAVLSIQGQHINYSRDQLRKKELSLTKHPALANTSSPIAPHSFVPSVGAQKPFWQYAVFGSGIGLSNIVIGPVPLGGGAREIIIGGNSRTDFGPDDFWQSVRRNATTGNYDQLFVSPVYSSAIRRIGLANVTGDSKQEVVVMLEDGRVYLYDFVSKTELGYISTGKSGLEGLSLVDLNNDGYAEVIVTTANDLFVFSGAGSLLWQVAGAGGYDVVAGQMDNDAAMEIAATNGKVVDAATHTVQWTRNTGFGAHLKLAPLPARVISS